MDTAPSGAAAVLQLYLSETRQLFNSMDPAPFRDRDLDPKAVDYIVDWAREQATTVPLALAVRLGQLTATQDETTLRAAVQDYFTRRAASTRRELAQLFRTGRISLVIGLLFLGGAILLGEAAAGLFSKDSYGSLAKESLVIGGWVALWRPMEIFLYDWWPIRARVRLYDRLAAMAVSLRGSEPA